MKLLHTSDWHLGMSFRGVNIQEDQEYFLEQIYKIIEEEKIEGILLAGDVFDRSVASAEAIALYDRAMTTLCGEKKLSLFMVAGNHDGAERLASCNQLLEKAGLYIKGALSTNLSPIEMEDVQIYLLPWFTLEKVRALFPESAGEIQSLEEAYAFVCEKMRATFNPDKRHILVGHAFIIHAETSVSDRSAEVGYAAAIGTNPFIGFDYVALGHLHGPQNIGENIRYSGTPMPYSFGKEEKQVKSVTVIDTDTMERKIIELEPLHARTTIAGTYQQLLYTEDISERVRKGYVRAELEDVHVGIEVIGALREVYPNLLEVSGKSFEQEDAKITMSIEELEEQEQDPLQIIKRYFQDVMSVSPEEHFMEMFEKAVNDYEKEEVQR